MNPVLVLLAVGFCYVAIFGGLAWLRREGLSLQFALEGLGITAAFALLALSGAFVPHPVLLLVILYLLTMRVRLLVDLARMLRHALPPARLLGLYEVALRLWPDASGYVVAQIDRGATLLRAGRPQEAADALESALARRPTRRFNPRYDAACHYNLGLAYQRLGKRDQAIVHFNQVIESLPGTIYAHLAQRAMVPKAGAAGRPAEEDEAAKEVRKK
ncbi:MAG: tetratricopeptide repeat protein [Chloroflexia bacterium]